MAARPCRHGFVLCGFIFLHEPYENCRKCTSWNALEGGDQIRVFFIVGENA